MKGLILKMKWLFISLFVVCGFVVGCAVPKVTHRQLMHAVEKDCPARAVRICRGMKRKKAFSLESCEQEVRVWCGMEVACMYDCRYPSHRQRPSTCLQVCKNSSKKSIQERFQKQWKKMCSSRREPSCIRKARMAALASYEKKLRETKPRGKPSKRLEGCCPVLSGGKKSGKRPAVKKPPKRETASRPTARRPTASRPAAHRPATSRPIPTGRKVP